jgi:hypothetical protein
MQMALRMNFNKFPIIVLGIWIINEVYNHWLCKLVRRNDDVYYNHVGKLLRNAI